MSSIQPNQSPSSMPSPSQAPEQSATVALSPHVLLMFPVCFLVGILCGRYLLSDYEGKSAQEWHTIAQQYMDKYSNSQKEQILQSQSTAQLDICLAGAESDYEAAILLNGKVVTGEDGQEHVRAERRIFDGASKDLERERDLCFRRFK